MSESPPSPSGGGSGAGNGGGGGFFRKFLLPVAKTAFENALNSTASGNSSTSGVPPSRSFFDFGGGSGRDSPDGSSYQVLEYSGRKANDEIAVIYPIKARTGHLILHGPRKDTGTPLSSTPYPLYNIILHSTNSSGSSERMYSLFRTESDEEAASVFIIYKEIFPDLVKATDKGMDKSTLDKIVKLAKTNTSFRAAHVAAALGMVDQLKSPVLQEKLADQEDEYLYTPLHVAINHGQLDVVNAIADNSQMLNRVYDLTDIKGNSIVHLAASCSAKSVGADVIKILKDKLLQQTGPARENTKRLFLELLMKVNNQGHSPLHLACIHDNEEAVKEITSSFDQCSSISPSSFLDLKDVATGNTPLHYATAEPTLLSHLLTTGCDPNITDNDGLTPLHKAVIANHLKSTLELLSNNAYADFKASFDGFNDATPLHMAATKCAADCMKALIVFGADIEMKDGNGFTARHIVASVYKGQATTRQEALFVLSAAGAKRCGPGVSGCTDGCKSGGVNNGKKPAEWRLSKDGTTCAGGPTNMIEDAMRGLSIVRESLESGVHTPLLRQGNTEGPVVGGRLLSLDGGGIRGLVLTQILYFMEKQFNHISGKGQPIISYFDWVAGTSTGGILALALASGKSTLATQSLYIKLKDKVFVGGKPYNAQIMEDFLKKEFGEERRMNSIQKPKTMIMTCLANRIPPDLYIFRNYRSPSSLLNQPEEAQQLPEDTFIWEAAKVTGAAPSYFSLTHEKFIDGGLMSNNPTLDALSELVQFKAVMMASQQSGRSNDNGWKLPALVLSLGTGNPPRQEGSAKDLDVAWPSGVFDAVRNVPRLTKLISLLVEQATQAEGQVVERSRAWCASIGVPFFRFSPEISEDIGLDEKDDDVLINMMWETWCYMVGHKDVIREIYERLTDLDIGKSSQNTSSNSGKNTTIMMDTS